MPGQGDELLTEHQVAELRAKDFWLYQWMDSYLVTSTQRAAALLQKAEPLEALRQIVYEAAQEKTSPPAGIIASDENIIVAGGNLDLSYDMACAHWDCRKKQVDGLFTHVWHYFDRIVVVGVSARDLNDQWDRYSNSESLIEHLLDDIRVLLYLRNIGADDLLVFAEKPEKCTQHWRKHAQEVGLRNALPEAKKLVEVFAHEVTLRLSSLVRATPTTHFVIPPCCDPSLPLAQRVGPHRLRDDRRSLKPSLLYSQRNLSLISRRHDS